MVCCVRLQYLVDGCCVGYGTWWMVAVWGTVLRRWYAVWGTVPGGWYVWGTCRVVPGGWYESQEWLQELLSTARAAQDRRPPDSFGCRGGGREAEYGGSGVLRVSVRAIVMAAGGFLCVCVCARVCVCACVCVCVCV